MSFCNFLDTSVVFIVTPSLKMIFFNPTLLHTKIYSIPKFTYKLQFEQFLGGVFGGNSRNPMNLNKFIGRYCSQMIS